jgi:hypothetical protein
MLYTDPAAVYSLPMANNRKELVEDFTTLVMGNIQAEETSPYRPRNPQTSTLSVRIPVELHKRFKKVKTKKGVELTQVVKHALGLLVPVILDGESPIDSQGSLLDQPGATHPASGTPWRA